MELKPGAKLGSYEIVSAIGRGGMGEVWKARDTQLGRDVAIKISAQQFSDRFEREARAIAAVNHPNVCTLYHIGPNYLVMEYIEGATLAERIKEGPIPLDEALSIAKQIANALEAAHEKGIVHRDLKPANVKIGSDGSVKVLDFGLAKAGGTQQVPSDSPTMMPETQVGMILGTAGYMAPEQARGKTVDKRADIWSFGVLLYEMLIGKRPFEGEDLTEMLAAVVKSEPNLAPLPQKVRRLVAKCLEKDPKKRLRDIGDVWELLDSPVGVARSPSRFGIILWVAVALVLVVIAGVALPRLRDKPRALPTYLSISLPENAEAAPVLSPDGRRVAISLRTGVKYQLWIRELNSPDLRPLGTEEAQAPFWSADGRFVGFFGDGKLRVVSAGGGPSQRLCDAESRGGGTWNRDGVILYSPGGGIFRVSASGGSCIPIRKADNGSVLNSPLFLPDGRHYFYTQYSDDTAKGGVYLASLDDSSSRRILADQSSVVYSPPARRGETGYVLFLRGATLMAQPFSTETLRSDGDALTVAPRAQFPSAGGNGMLVYLSNGPGSRPFQLAWFDRSGKKIGDVSRPGPPGAPSFGLDLSPDEKMVALSQDEQQRRVPSLSVYDLSRNAEHTLSASARSPVWSPDGTRIVFSKRGAGSAVEDLYSDSINGGLEGILLKSGNPRYASDVSRDARYLIYTEIDPTTRADIWILPDPFGTSRDRKPVPFLRTPFLESQGRISPDGHWIAYVSFESGQREVYVRPFPSGEGKWQISTRGGHQPRWRGDGKELFYLEGISPRNRLMAVPLTLGNRPDFGSPKPLFEILGATTLPQFNSFAYSPSADGQHFLVNAFAADAQPTVDVLVNWTASLKK
jgi:Tol biopolymer transport system component/predicted Ser/Thr protein kinase